MSADSETIEQEKIKLQRPAKWLVIIHNDDSTPMDFVVELLYTVFGMDFNTATALMLTVHYDGQAVAGIYTHEIAEQKIAEANEIINLSRFPLKLTMQIDS